METTVPLTAARLRELIEYRDGELFWRNPTGLQKRTALGAKAGHGGRLQTPVDGKAYYVHRLVWLYHHGFWPCDQVDLGVSFDGRKAGSACWRTRIQSGGRMHSLGYYDTPEAAHEAYLLAKEDRHPFWSGNRVA